MIHLLKKLVPKSVKQEIKKELNQIASNSSPIHANLLLSKLYHPMEISSQYPIAYFLDQKQKTPKTALDSYPIPPSHMRMGYAANNDKEYMESGYYSAGSLLQILNRHKFNLQPGITMLDWGCATGRVLRYFAKEAAQGEFWGMDQDAASIQWNKENLSPPFHFMNCTAYPHLPFEDNKFDLIYGLSVFTHIYHCYDLWLMEFRRILKKGGYAIFTVVDEYCWEYMRKNGKLEWMPEQDFTQGLPHDLTVYGGEIWGGTFVFVKRDWVKKEWGRYLQVIEIEPAVEGYQTAILLRKE